MQNITTGTVVRTLCLLLALINQMMTAAGKSVLPIEDDTIGLFVSTGMTMITSIVAWWKNNSFTTEAIEADKKKKSYMGAGESPVGK